MRFWLFIAAFVLILFGAAAYNLHGFNQFTPVENLPLKACAPVSGIAGPEDIAIDEAHGLAFISSLDRRTQGARGAVHAFDINDPLADAGWRDRTGGVPEAFRPLGVSYYEDSEVRRLFVVNEAGPAVELYDVLDNGDLAHVASLSERRLTSPNDVAAVGANRFYVTNDVRSGRAGALANLSFLMRMGSGDVYYVNGSQWSLAAEGLRFANGVAAGRDGERLYVAETSGQALKVFDRDDATGRLSPAATIPLGASPDNVNVDAGGVVWIAALPRPLAVARLMRDEHATAPSEVIRVDPDGETRTIYRDDGAQHSAATVAARGGSKLFIGALYEEKFLFCDLGAAGEGDPALPHPAPSGM